MTVHIGEISTEVVATTRTAATGAPIAETPWAELDRAKAIARRVRDDHARTAAEGFSD